MDPTTFMASPAAAILVDRLNKLDNPKLTRRVSAFIHHTFNGFIALTDVENDAFFKKFIVLWRKHRLEQVDFHEELDTYVKTIITSESRNWIRGAN
jgi:hypothetical protein